MIRPATERARRVRTHQYVLCAAVLAVVASCGENTPTETPEPVSITTTTLAGGVVGAAYSESLLATGGGGGHTWSLTTGTLPAGLSLTSASGLIDGTPTADGSSAFTVQATGTNGETATQALSIDVDPQPILLPTELCSANPSYAIVTFDEADIDEAARDDIGLGVSDPFTCALAATVESLSAWGVGLTSLSGVQNLTGLIEATLDENSISDLGPLSGLTSLFDLDLEQNLISDISPLSGLSSLAYLELEDNSVTDLSPLSGLTGLLDLGLDWNGLSDLSPLSGLTGLTALSVDHNAILDISPIAGMTEMVDLDIDQNNLISDISALASMTKLIDLEADGNQISDLSPLTDLTTLEDMDLDGNPITDIGPLEGLVNLFYLGLSGTDVSDIQPLLDNTGLGSGDTVDLESTNVSCDDGSLLGAKGVTVLGVVCPIVLLSPAADAVLDNGCNIAANGAIWDFDWEDYPNATHYWIWIQKAGANVLRNVSNLTESQYRYDSVTGYSTNDNLTGWFWRVSAYANGVWTDWSEERPFSLEPVNTDC